MQKLEQLPFPPSSWTLFYIGLGADPLRDGFQATSLDQDEVERILDACIKHSDHWSGFKVSAMVLLGTAMGFRGKLKMQRWAAVTLHYQELHWIELELSRNLCPQVMTLWMLSQVY